MLKAYQYHKPSPESAEKMTRLRRAFSALHEFIEREVPASREKSLALTNLEQAAMWAGKAVVHNDPKSEVV